MLKFFNHSKQRSIFLTFLVSYLALLIIPLVIGIMDYVRYSSIVKKETENYNLAMLRQAQSVIDERLGGIEQLALDISANQLVQNFVTVKKEMDNNDILSMMNVTKELSKYKGMNTLVNDIYIYFNKSDVILTADAKYTPELYYELMYSGSKFSYDGWKNALAARRYKEYVIPQDEAAVRDRSSINLFMSLRTGPGSISQGTVVIVFKNSKILDIFKEVDFMGKDVVYIINSRDEIITSTGNRELIKPDQHTDFGAGGNYQYTKIQDKDVIVSYVPSKMSDWIYVSVIPLDVLMEKIYSTRNITLFIVATGLIIGIILAFLLSRRNTTPIRRLVEKLKGSIETADLISFKNEIEYIEGAAMAVIKEKIDIRTAMEDQMPALRASLMIQLLKGNIADQKNLEHALHSVGIRFEEPNFRVMLITIESCGDESLKKEWSLVKFIITNILLELGNEKNSAFVLDLEWDQMALLVNLKEESTSEGEFYEMAVKIRDIMTEKFFTDISIGIGDVYKGTAGIKTSYSEAVKALEYKIFKGHRSITLFKDVSVGDQNYIYSIETEMQLIKSVKFGDFETVQTLLKEIFEQNLANKSLSLEMARCFYFDIMNTGIKILSSINIEYEELFGKDMHPVDRLTSCNTIDKMHETLELIFRKICGYISSIKVTPGNEEMIANIAKYMLENCSDPSLSLASVAKEFNMGASHLSHVFKAYTGQNFVDYLREKRIEKARDMLRETSLSLEQVAQATGYVNSNVLIRNFKKLENLTPGQYREKFEKLKTITCDRVSTTEVNK